jgi:hypothetical protein
MLNPGIHRVKNNASNSELQAAIEAVIPMATKQMQSRSKQFKGANEQESCKKIFDYLKALNYKADGNEQQVRLPSGLVRTQTGDCKSYAVFTSAVLSNLKIPHYLVYTSYNPADKTPTHVYVVTKNNCIVDAVWGKFNSEKKPTHKIKKPMNISYIAGTGSRMGATSCSNNNTSSGIMGAATGKQWAESLGIWKSLPNVVTLNYTKNQVLLPYATGRGILLALLRKNAGGMATSLNNIYLKARANNASDEFKKYRAFEIEFLQKGGNPDNLREAIQEGSTKTPTGQYFNKLMKMKAGGYNPNIVQWIAAGMSLLFGKKYNESTGQITGNDMGIGTGEPVSTTAGLLSSAPVWAQLVGYVSATLGTAYIAAKVGQDPVEARTTPTDVTPTDTTTSTGSGTRSLLTPVLLIGGAAAAYFLLTSKNK